MMGQSVESAGLTELQGLDFLRAMLRIRRFEERAAELYTVGLIRGFLHLYIGEEAVAAGLIPQLRPDDDIVSTYREHGHALLRGTPARALMAELFGRASGCSRGRGGSMHFFDAERRFYGGLAIVAGGLPVAVGLALAARMQGRDAITACIFGDGAVAEGEFHESLNLASLWRLPVLFVCENNFYAMGTSLERHQAMTDIHRKADAYNMASAAVDGMDVLSVDGAARTAVEYVRNRQRPYLLECRTYRFRGHSMYDADAYRDRGEVTRWKQRDPIQVFRARLLDERLVSTDALAALDAEVEAEISDAVAFAEAAPLEPVEALTEDVLSPLRSVP